MIKVFSRVTIIASTTIGWAIGLMLLGAACVVDRPRDPAGATPWSDSVSGDVSVTTDATATDSIALTTGQAVTTSSTGVHSVGDPGIDTTDFFLIEILEPKDETGFWGCPDALITVVIEFMDANGGGYVGLSVDDGDLMECESLISPCALDISLPPGNHTLVAMIAGGSHSITVTVVEKSGAEDGSTSCDYTHMTDGNDSTSDAGSETGCGCSADRGGLDKGELLLVLAFGVRRRRRAAARLLTTPR